MTAATPGGRPPHQQELLMKKKKHSPHRRERPQGRKVKQYPRHQASLSLLLPYAQPDKRQQILPHSHNNDKQYAHGALHEEKLLQQARPATTANPSHSHETSSQRKHISLRTGGYKNDWRNNGPGTKNNIYRYTDQRSPKNCKTSASDHQEDQPRWPPCWNQELTQRDNKEVHIIPSANIEDPRHQDSLSLLLPYAQPGKR